MTPAAMKIEQRDPAQPQPALQDVPANTCSRPPPARRRCAHRSAGSAAQRARSRRCWIVRRIHGLKQNTCASRRNRCRPECQPATCAVSSGYCRVFVEEIVDLARGFGVDAGNMRKIGERGALDRLQGAEMLQQRALARRADAGDFLQAGLADILLAPLAGASRWRSGAPRRAAAARNRAPDRAAAA